MRDLRGGKVGKWREGRHGKEMEGGKV